MTGVVNNNENGVVNGQHNETNDSNNESKPQASSDPYEGMSAEELRQELLKTRGYNEKRTKEAINHKQKARELEQQLEQIKLQQMEEQNQFKEQANYWKSKAEEHESKYSSLNQEIEKSRKKEAFTQELIKLGVNKDDLPVIMEDLSGKYIDQIQVDKESNVMFGADDAALQLKERFNKFFVSKQPGVNQSASSSDKPSQIDIDWWRNLSPEERKKPENRKLIFEHYANTKMREGKGGYQS